MNFNRLFALATLLFAAICTPVRAETVVGVKSAKIEAAHRISSLDVTIWYPATSGGEQISVGESAVFTGVTGLRNAPIAEGSHPAVLVSLGGLRAAPDMANWLGAAFARKKFIAIIVSPPQFGPQDAAIAVQDIWKRPDDLSGVLTSMEGNPDWATHMDRDRIGAVGFFLGGTSVLALAGARLDGEQFAQSCDAGGTGIDCEWFKNSGINLHSLDSELVEGSHHDLRVKAVMAIDPEFGSSFSQESLSQVSVPIKVINLGSAYAVAPGLDGSMLADGHPGMEYSTLPQASKFSAFGICKPKGAAILAEEGSPAEICQADGATGRQTIHDELTGLIHGLFEKEFSKTSQ